MAEADDFGMGRCAIGEQNGQACHAANDGGICGALGFIRAFLLYSV